MWYFVIKGCILLAVLCAETEARVRGKGKRKGGGAGKKGSALVTCPGFPGYCSESYPGDVCLVVCAFGRNNVPQCQEDGTWSDEPRCIEHEAGASSQVTDFCPGVPGYCSLDYPGGLCTFECLTGPHIRSSCAPDGTWQPYPTCENDVRETKDGCDPCPGPFGKARNRTSPSITSRGGSSAQTSRIGGHPKRGGGGGGKRKSSGGKRRGGGKGGCPDAVLRSCIDACPGVSPKLFSACVKGCTKRC